MRRGRGAGADCPAKFARQAPARPGYFGPAGLSLTSGKPVLRASDSRYGFFDPQASALGREFRDRYFAAQPFPHIILDDFLDAEILEQCLREFPLRSASGATYGRAQEQGKVEFKPELL